MPLGLLVPPVQLQQSPGQLGLLDHKEIQAPPVQPQQSLGRLVPPDPREIQVQSVPQVLLVPPVQLQQSPGQQVPPDLREIQVQLVLEFRQVEQRVRCYLRCREMIMTPAGLCLRQGVLVIR